MMKEADDENDETNLRSAVEECLNYRRVEAAIQESSISSTTPTRSRHDSYSRFNHESNAVNQNVPVYKESPKHQVREANLWDYINGEVRRGYALENDEQKYIERRERFYSFLKIPLQLEKFLRYGFLQCADAFLFVFTLLPLRFVMSTWFLISRPVKNLLRGRSVASSNQVLHPSETCDFLKGIIVIVAAFLMSYVDTSVLYHNIKTQSVMKLYIFFNMLDVADKLFSSFGQDILDALFWTATEPRSKKRESLTITPHLAMAVGYVFLHTVLVLLQATCLNVAINSKNKALLTIMMSNNFVELKGFVFKKFEKNNLFHMSCSDARERFCYIILLFVVFIQTLKEYNWSEVQMMVLLEDCVYILLAEVLVDWTKHAFITRFNDIPIDIYSSYKISLAYDLAASKLKSAFSDHSDIVSRRMGFIPLPLGVLVFRIVSGAFPMYTYYVMTCGILLFLVLLSMKCWINIMILGQACEYIERHRSTNESKAPPPRISASLPSSRHHSMDNLTTAFGLNCSSKSTPESQVPSHSSSLADITEQAAIMQETLEKSMIFSDSQVSLLSLSLEETQFRDRGKVLGAISEKDDVRCFSAGSKNKSILRNKSFNESGNLRRRVSLQETITSATKYKFTDLL
ncbi:Protein TAPT1 -like protein [Halotydeus destructor]|nr:Protein TAPT1 -like protein [Halotydeus destructor]